MHAVVSLALLGSKAAAMAALNSAMTFFVLMVLCPVMLWMVVKGCSCGDSGSSSVVDRTSKHAQIRHEGEYASASTLSAPAHQAAPDMPMQVSCSSMNGIGGQLGRFARVALLQFCCGLALTEGLQAAFDLQTSLDMEVIPLTVQLMLWGVLLPLWLQWLA